MLDFRYPDKPTTTTRDAVLTWLMSMYIAQWKYDGWRLGIYRDAGRFRFLTSSGGQMIHVKFTQAIKNLLSAIEMPDNSILDAEFVGPRGDHPSSIYIFDCLAWDGGWLTMEPFEKRWSRCCNLTLPKTEIVQLAKTFESGGIEEFDRLKQNWHDTGRPMDLTEGIIFKQRAGKLTLDLKRSKKSACQFKCKYRDIRERR